MNTRIQTESALREWLRDHYGVIGHLEALRLGASPRTIQTKVQRGEWVRIYRGVYRHSAAPRGPWQDLRAACVLTAGFGVVSHGSAAWAWGLLAEPPALPEVTVHREGRHMHGHPKVTIHRSRDLDVTRAVNRNSILVTNPLRTLVDLAGTATPGRLTEAVDSALAKRLVTAAGLEAEIQRLSRPGRNGVAVLRRHLLDRGFIGAPAPSVLEAHIRRLIRSTGLPTPAVEVRVGEEHEYRLDIAWAAIHLAVEVDGYAWHFSPEHMRRDVTRRNHLEQAGWTVLVFTWHQVVIEPTQVAQQITATYHRLSPAA